MEDFHPEHEVVTVSNPDTKVSLDVKVQRRYITIIKTILPLLQPM